MQSDTMIGIAIIVRNDAPVLREVVTELTALLSSEYAFYEILFVDLASEDETVATLRDLMKSYPNLRLIRLSNCHDTEIGISAALNHTIGDYCILMDPYLDAPKDVLRLIEAATPDTEMVIARRKGGPTERWGRRTYYKLASKLLGRKLSPEESDFRLLTRKAVNAICKMKDRRRHVRYFSELLGFRKVVIDCQVSPRAEKFQRRSGVVRGIRRSLDLVISNSAAPLRFAAGLGLLASFFNLLYLGYVLLIAIFKQQIAEGWLTTSVVLSTMFFCLFIIMSVLSEYVARILEETKDRPLYFIEYQEQSSVSTINDRQLLNVVEADS